MPYMTGTVWYDQPRHEHYRNQTPGMQVAGDIAVRDKDWYYSEDALRKIVRSCLKAGEMGEDPGAFSTLAD